MTKDKEPEVPETEEKKSEAELGDGTEATEQPKPKLDKKKKIIIAAVAAIVLLGAIGGFLYKKKHAAKEATPPAEHQAEGETHGAPDAAGEELLVFYQLEPFLVNLNSPAKQQNYLKLTVSLQLENDKIIKQIEHNLPIIRDGFQVFLRELTADDIKGSAGIYTLREELLLRINKVIAPAKVEDILFKEILVQ
jgi:flagellar FliL protein